MSNPLRYKTVIDPKKTNTSHAHIVKRVPAGSTVLDVGCACGDMGAWLAQHKGCQIDGLEYDLGAIEEARATGCYGQVVQADLNGLKALPASLDRPYDVIILGDVLEHLINPDALLALLRPALKAGGKFIISLPNIAHGSIVRQLFANAFDYMDYGILDATHLRFFTSQTMAALLARAQLEVMSSGKVIYDLMGLHTTPLSATPAPLLRHLEEVNHAFVLQYVVDARPTQRPDVRAHNQRLLDAFSDDELALISRKRFVRPTASVTPGQEMPLGAGLSLTRARMLLPLRMFLKRHLPAPAWNALKRCVNLAYVKPASHNERKAYLQFLFSTPAKVESRSTYVPNPPEYHPVSSCAAAIPPEADTPPRLVAFYLPQFYPFEENNTWWGRGFTEWTNVTKAVPQYAGHHQPQLPIDLGFYDLRVPEVMARQIELARAAGIYGFCFHYYWFSGRRLMERPIFDFLKRAELDFPFCLCWANEPWSRRWDGSDQELLMEQTLRREDDALFIRDILPFITDRRYITIGGQPLLLIYRPQYWTKERVRALTGNMRAEAKRHGLPGLYLAMCLTQDFNEDAAEWGFDAAVEFPPHGYLTVARATDVAPINPRFRGGILDMKGVVEFSGQKRYASRVVFKTVFPAWDNTARKPDEGVIFHGASPALYGQWLQQAMEDVRKRNAPHERFVFINAWNEWAEGAHLEPDRHYGYAWLHETAAQVARFGAHKQGGKTP